MGADVALICVTVVIVAIDIILAMCLRVVLPDYATLDGTFPVGKEASFEEAVKICPCLALVYPEGTDSMIVFEATTKTKRQIGNRQTRENNYRFLVSLSIPAYSDDTEEKLFVCNGLISSATFVVSSKTCLDNDDEWLNLTVRSDSLYWSKLGNEHAVVNFSHIDDNLVLLQITPEFPEILVPRPPLNYTFVGDWVHAVSLGWDDRMYKKGSKFRFMHRSYDTEEWTSRNQCGTMFEDICHQPQASSKFLITSCHQLIGAETVNEENTKFSSLKELEKSCYQIYKDTCKVSEIDVC